MPIQHIRLTAMLLITVSFYATVAWAEQPLEDRYRQAQLHLRDGAFEQAYTLLTRIVEDDPQHAQALRWLGHAAWELDRFDTARGAYRRALAQGMMQSDVLIRLAQLQREAGEIEAAREALRLAMLTDEEVDDSPLQLSLAQLDERLGDHASAQRRLEALTQQHPADMRLWLQLGNVHLRQQDHHAAYASLRLAWYLGAQEPGLTRVLGDLCLRLEPVDTQRAVRWYQLALEEAKAADAEKAELAAIHSRLGQLLLQDGDLEAARAHLEAWHRGSDDPQARVLLGHVALRLGDETTALEHWRSLADEARAPRDVLVYLGLHHHEQEQDAKAVNYLSLGLDAEAPDARTLQALVISHHRLQRMAEARHTLRQYVARFGLDDTAVGLARRLRGADRLTD